MTQLTTTNDQKAQRREIAAHADTEKMAATVGVSPRTMAAYVQAATNEAVQVKNLEDGTISGGLAAIADKYWPNSMPTDDCIEGCVEVLRRYPLVSLAEVNEAVSLACAHKLPTIAREASGTVKVYANLSPFNLGEILAAYTEDTRRRMIAARAAAAQKEADASRPQIEAQKAAAARAQTIAEIAPLWGTAVEWRTCKMHWGDYLKGLCETCPEFSRPDKDQRTALRDAGRRTADIEARAAVTKGEARAADVLKAVENNADTIYRKMWMAWVISQNKKPA